MGIDEFADVFGPARIMGGEEILVAMLVSFILSMCIATVYRWTYQGLS